MQNENGSGEGSSGQLAQVGEPDHLRVEAGEGKKVRVEVDGRVMCGKLAVVTIVDDEGPQLVRWEKLEAGCLYVDRFASGDVSGVLQVGNDGKTWRWAWTPYSSTGGWGERYWHEQTPAEMAEDDNTDTDAPAAELVGQCASDEIADARATFEPVLLLLVVVAVLAFDRWRQAQARADDQAAAQAAAAAALTASVGEVAAGLTGLRSEVHELRGALQKHADQTDERLRGQEAGLQTVRAEVSQVRLRVEELEKPRPRRR